MEALREVAGPGHPNTVYAVGTVQEETGLRGARTSAFAIDPDVCIVLEVDIAGDVPGIKPEESSVKMGGGPTMLLYDRSMIPNLKLRDMVIATAEELEIPLQFSAMAGGATDGGPIHLHNEGVPTVVLGVPTRHIHSHHAMICREDYDQAKALVVARVKKRQALGLAMNMSWTMLFSLLIPLLAGVWLDKKLGTVPLFILIGAILGISAATIGVARMTIRTFGQTTKAYDARKAAALEDGSKVPEPEAGDPEAGWETPAEAGGPVDAGSLACSCAGRRIPGLLQAGPGRSGP